MAYQWFEILARQKEGFTFEKSAPTSPLTTSLEYGRWTYQSIVFVVGAWLLNWRPPRIADRENRFRTIHEKGILVTEVYQDTPPSTGERHNPSHLKSLSFVVMCWIDYIHKYTSFSEHR